MVFRYILLLTCIALFINGCNSLISNVAGTHKLRDYSYGQIVQDGIGDADHISISDGWTLSNEFLVILPEGRFKRSILVYPILSELQKERLENGQKITPEVLAWTHKFDPNCASDNSCLTSGSKERKGLVANYNRVKNNLPNYKNKNIIFEEDIIFLEDGRRPIAWYWHLVTMIGVVLIALFVERRNFNKQKNNSK